MAMLRVFTISCSFLFISVGAICQNLNKADSLINELDSKLLLENERINLLLTIANNHPDASISLNYAFSALELAVKAGDLQLQAEAYEEIGAIERLLGNNLESTEASLKALKLFEQLGRDDLKVAVLAQLGSNAVNDQDYDLAVSYFHQTMMTYEKEGNFLMLAMTEVNLGEAHRLDQQPDSAIFWFQEALSLNDSLNHPIIASYALGNLGMTYNAQGDLEQARMALTSSLDMVKELGDPYTHAVYLADLGLVNQKEGDWKRAEIDFTEALNIAKENGLKEPIRDISGLLVKFYKLRNDYKTALIYQELFQIYQDSLVNKANIQQLEQLKANYQIDQKEVEIGYLNALNTKQKQQIAGVIGVMIIFAGLSFMLYKSNRQKIKANVILASQKELIARREGEKALLLKELNHRVKNNLQMISSLLNLQRNELKGHPAEAAIIGGKYRVDALALIHQKLYSKEAHTQIAIKDYVEELVLNLCYSFGNKATPVITIKDINISIDQAIPIALIINELITNALKYAFNGIERPELNVTLETHDQNLILQIRDNGAGFTPKDSENSHSFGIKLVHSLVAQLKAHVTHTNDPGSCWLITLPHQSITSPQT